jgi:hypothetical protein
VCSSSISSISDLPDSLGVGLSGGVEEKVEFMVEDLGSDIVNILFVVFSFAFLDLTTLSVLV